MICEPLEHFRYTGKTAWKIDPMSDLVERLRAWHTPGETITGDVQIYLDAAARIEALEAALRGAEQDWVAGEIKLLERIKEMLDAPHNYRRKHIMDEIDLAIAALAPEQDK